MGSRRPLAIAAVLVPVVAAAGWSVHLRSGHSADAQASPVVALVNGTAITADDLQVRLGDILPSASYHGQVAADRVLSLRRAALDDLVLDELIYREAVAAGQSATRTTVEAEVAAVKARFETAELFASALRELGLNERDFRARAARTVLVREQREAHARQAVTDADIAAYYRDHEAMFQHPEQVHLLEVLVRADPADPASSGAAARKARAILARLRRGDDFARVARASSDDEYRVKDGDMGFVHRGRLDGAFDAAVFASSPGRLAIARSLYGYEVLKVLERRPATRLSLEEARPIIAGRLERQRREDALRRWHARLLAGARVTILEASLREARPADLGAGPTTLATRLRTGSATGNGQ